MDLGLQGRVAVITGGSMGIGKATASALAAEGVDVVLLARTQENLDQAADEIRGNHDVNVSTVSADITDSESVNAAAQKIAATVGTVNILVNNAGHRMRRFDRQIMWDDADWQADIENKTVGMLRVIRALLPHMATDGTGNIINVGGMAGVATWETAMTHGINNAAMHHATGYLAADLAQENIRVNAVVPGLVATEWRQGWAGMMSEKLGKTKEEFLADYCRKIGAISGRWAEMEEVADTIVFLVSDRARYFNGARIPVDGGISAHAF